MKNEPRPTIETLKLGSLARDTITGFEGVIIARTEWLNGCVRVSLQPRELKDGKPIEAICFDIQQVTLVEPGAGATKQSGGPMPNPSRAPDPAR